MPATRPERISVSKIGPVARTDCRTDRPALRVVAAGHEAACHYAEEVMAGVDVRGAA